MTDIVPQIDTKNKDNTTDAISWNLHAIMCEMNTLYIGLFILSNSSSECPSGPLCSVNFFVAPVVSFFFTFTSLALARTALLWVPNTVKSHSFSHLSKLLLVLWMCTINKRIESISSKQQVRLKQRETTAFKTNYWMFGIFSLCITIQTCIYLEHLQFVCKLRIKSEKSAWANHSCSTPLNSLDCHTVNPLMVNKSHKLCTENTS